MKKHVIIHTDGACSGNPGPGGWGALLQSGDHMKELSGGEDATTNNRMELTAVIRALQQLKNPCRVEIVTDSKYVMHGITEWIKGWKRNGWKTASRQPVKNVDLWQELDKEIQSHEVTWHWVKGHNGHDGNELADALARKAILSLRR